MTEMRDAIIFVRFWHPPNVSPSPDATNLTILITLMTVRGGAIILCRILARPPPMPQYLNDREMGALLSFVGFGRPLMTPPPPDATIFNYLNDREREREEAPLLFCRILAPPNAPPPTIPKYFTILMTEMRDAIILVGFWNPPMRPLL